MKIPVLALDVPNMNHRIYPKEVMEKAIAKYRKEFVEAKRAFIVKRLPESASVNLQDVIGTVKEITIEGGRIVLDVEFLPGMQEALAADIGIRGGTLHLRTAGVGSIKKKEDGTYVIGEDYELVACFITNNPA